MHFGTFFIKQQYSGFTELVMTEFESTFIDCGNKYSIQNLFLKLHFHCPEPFK